MTKDERRTAQRKLYIFDQIEALLDQCDLQNVTYGQIAKLCGCQPNSITYYFKNKMDMLLQFTEHILQRESSNLFQLRVAPLDLTPVQRFCREIDILFSLAERKSKPRLLSNSFILSNSPIQAEFERYLSASVLRENRIYLDILESYQPLGILSEERFLSTYAELCFDTNAFSISHIFKMPTQEYDLQLHNAKEYLKSSFLKDGLYLPQYKALSVPLGYPPHANGTIPNQQALYGAGTDLPERVFSIIEELLAEGRIQDITFAYLAGRCYCQPSSITYYFKNKMDMLLQFTLYYLGKNMTEITTHPIGQYVGSPTGEAFISFLDEVIDCTFRKSTILYWVNYIVICNMTSIPEFYQCLTISLNGKIEFYWSVVTFYREKGLLNEASIAKAFSDLVFFSDSLALLSVFRIPIAEQPLLLRTLRTRLITEFLKPEYLPRDYL